jgi:iron complex transport system substrate-binding protein
MMGAMPAVERIVSLLPSATEIVSSLGLGDLLVGRSHECDFPTDVVELPACTAARLSTGASSADIDREVKGLLGEALSIYSIDESMLRSLSPQLIVTQSQCEVCAVSLADVEQAMRRTLGDGVRIVSLEAENLEGIWGDIEAVASAAGVEEAAGRLVSALRERVADIERRTERPLSEQPSVMCIEWMDPLMSAGNWMPDIVEKAGGRPVLAHAGEASPWIDWQQVREENPDFIVVLPCGFDIDRTRTEIDLLQTRPEWMQLTAVQSDRVFLADGNQYFNRPGPRIIDSIEIIAELLHPALFSFGHEGSAWESL